MALLLFFYSTVMSLLKGFCWSQDVTAANSSSVMSSVGYPGRRLRSGDWDYLRVEIPPGFSSLTMTLYSDTDVEGKIMVKSPATVLPIMCLRSGGLPLPDITERLLDQMASNFILNGDIGASLNLQSAVHCFPFRKTLKLNLTNEQIPYGVWYVGYFYGLGPQRTQSKMIDRGNSHKFTFSLTIEGCNSPSMWGPYCNQTVDIPSCASSLPPMHSRGTLEVTMDEDSVHLNSPIDVMDQFLESHRLQYKPRSQDFVQFSKFYGQRKYKNSRSRMLVGSESSIVMCNTSNITCIGNRGAKFYSLKVTHSVPLFEIMAIEVKFSQTTTINNRKNIEGISLTCYVRHNAIPSREMHDNSADLMTSSLIISSPKVGRWYVAVEVVNKTKVNNGTKESDFSDNLCFSFNWQIRECPDGKAGLNCSWQKYILQRVIRKRFGKLPFDSYYLPESWYLDNQDHFSLEPFLSNSSSNENSTDVWTYFYFNIPAVVAGSNLHIQVKSDTIVNYEIYLKFGGGFPSLSDWDYYMNRSMSRSNDSMILMVDEYNEKTIDFYIVYPMEGTWSLGVKSNPLSKNHLEFQSRLSISTEKCPRGCSSHGSCITASDISGSTIIGYCSCDRNHGGFDCSNELINFHGHILRSFALIASNAAAILPAFFAFLRKAYAESLIYTASGFASAIYHACDVGTWCPLSYSVLQFLDFWLSFMAVGSTFIYLTTTSENTKKFFLTGFSILTALLAVNGATNSANIIAIMSIGAVFLLFGWLMECLPKFCQSRSNTSVFHGCNCNIRGSWKVISGWPRHMAIFFLRRFLWYYTLLGFVALTAAATCWSLENRYNYWIWHSLWHITIYTSSFFFLCSAVEKNEVRNEEESVPANELPPESPRQDDSTEGRQ